MAHVTPDFKELLRQSGFKATPGRLALLELLDKEPKPLTVAVIEQKLDAPMNAVTLYRALEALTDAGILVRVDFLHGHAHFELAVGKKHHHHVVCITCGVVEDVKGCAVGVAQESVAKQSEKFKTIYSHNLEFFGSCLRCAK